MAATSTARRSTATTPTTSKTAAPALGQPLAQVLAAWDGGQRRQRLALLHSLAARFPPTQPPTAMELEALLGNGASLLLARLAAWLRITYVDWEDHHGDCRFREEDHTANESVSLHYSFSWQRYVQGQAVTEQLQAISIFLSAAGGYGDKTRRSIPQEHCT